MKRVPVILGRNDRNVGGRRQNVDDIVSEADPPGPANLLPADSKSDSNDTGGGGDSDSESDSA